MSHLGIPMFIAAILISVGLHEFGHFITAKRFGIKVEQFFIGFGPRLWSVRKGETEYGVRAIPLGGFVKITGMGSAEEVAPEDRDRVFSSRKPWQRAIVLSAGSAMHFIIAFGITVGLLLSIGQGKPTTTIDAVEATLDGHPSPAAVAGIVPGDNLYSIQGVRITSWDQAVDIIRSRAGKRTEMVFGRNGAIRRVTVVVADHKPGGAKTGFVGIGPKIEIVPLGPLTAARRATVDLWLGAKASVLGVRDVFAPSSLSRLVRVAAGRAERKATDPATLVGLGAQAGGVARAGDFVMFFYMIAGFNIFVGVVNLLPLPPLDGGHLAMLAYEKIRGRPADMRRVLPIAVTVMSIFGSLFLLLLYLDIVHPLPPLPG